MTADFPGSYDVCVMNDIICIQVAKLPSGTEQRAPTNDVTLPYNERITPVLAQVDLPITTDNGC